MAFLRTKRYPEDPTARTPRYAQVRILNALKALSARSIDGFVAPQEIASYLGESALSLGLTKILESLEEGGWIEHKVYPDGTGGDRPTHAGLAHFNLLDRPR